MTHQNVYVFNYIHADIFDVEIFIKKDDSQKDTSEYLYYICLILIERFLFEEDICFNIQDTL